MRRFRAGLTCPNESPARLELAESKRERGIVTRRIQYWPMRIVALETSGDQIPVLRPRRQPANIELAMRTLPRLRFGLSCVSALVWVAFIGPLAAQEGREQKALEQLRKMNVGLQFDEQSPQRPLIGVDCSQVQFTDIGFKYIRLFPTIQKLNLSKTLITDSGMKNLRELTELQELTVEHTAITSAGLDSIRDLPKLWILNIDFCQKLDAEAFLAIRELKALRILVARGVPISDKSLEYWAAEKPVHEPPAGSKTKPRKLKVDAPNPALVTFYLTSTQKITDVGAEHLTRLPTLMEITLSDSAITEKTIQRFARLPVLRTLNVSNSPNLGDDSLASLQDFQALKVCWFVNTAITDAGLKHLERATTLERINVQQSKVTQAGVDALRAARPDLTVEF